MSDTSAAATAGNVATEASTSPEAVSEEILPEELAELEASNAEPTKQEQKAIEKAMKKFKLKVDGKEEDFEIDLSDEKEIAKHLQLSRAASKRMQEAAELRKQTDAMRGDIEELLLTLRNDPLKILQDPAIGHDVKKLALQVLEQEEQEASKSPEQKEKERLQLELESAQKKLKEAEEKRQQEEFQRLQQQAEREIEADIISAIEKSDLPKTEIAVKRMAEAMLVAMQNGIDVNAYDVVPIVRKQMLKDLRQLAGILPEDMLEEILGNDKVASLRKRHLRKIKEKQQVTPSEIKQTTAQRLEQKEVSKVKARDFFKKLGSS